MVVEQCLFYPPCRGDLGGNFPPNFEGSGARGEILGSLRLGGLLKIINNCCISKGNRVFRVCNCKIFRLRRANQRNKHQNDAPFGSRRTRGDCLRRRKRPPRASRPTRYKKAEKNPVLESLLGPPTGDQSGPKEPWEAIHRHVTSTGNIEKTSSFSLREGQGQQGRSTKEGDLI